MAAYYLNLASQFALSINSLFPSTGSSLAAGHCTNFTLPATLDFDGIRLTGKSYHAHGELVQFGNGFGSLSSDSLPSFCRLALAVKATVEGGRDARMELWLPDKGEWNGRLLGVGNGGWSGEVIYSALGGEGLRNHFAAFSTDTGHSSSVFDGEWAQDNPEGIVDHAWRVLHVASGFAPRLATAFYAAPVGKKYWLGCSTGGRQGLKEAQEFPEDFDGVVVGSPARYISRLQPWSAYVWKLLQTPETAISREQWLEINGELLRQCDLLDGVADGIIGHPPDCHPDWSAFKGLSATQLVALRKVYEPYSIDGERFFPGLSLGGENGPINHFTPSLNGITLGYYRHFIHNDSSWDPHSYSDADARLSIEQNPGNVDAVNPDLSAFREKGGKIIHYAGWGDKLIPPLDSVDYYEAVKATASEQGIEVDSFYRFFPVPGMAHCSGGHGANSMGGENQAAFGNPPLKNDARHDVVLAMVEWVENGVPPTEFIAARWKDDQAKNGLDFTRRLCMWPNRAVYRHGTEAATTAVNAEDFECIAPSSF